MASLKDLDFTDLYIKLTKPGDVDEPARYNPRIVNKEDGGLANMQVPREYDMEIQNLVSNLEKNESDDYSLDYGGLRMRVTRRVLSKGNQWASIRRINSHPPLIGDLGFTHENINLFKSWGKRPSGLIVVGGSTGAGKTTTAVSLLSDWLKNYGQVAFTVEDPIEYYLNGEMYRDNGEPGGNYVFQTEVEDDSGWKKSIQTALRWKPRYIFVGEVRTQEAAEGILRAATSGHLAICTVHGGTIEETVSAIVQNACNGPYGMNRDNAYGLLADGLCGIIHQDLNNGVVTQSVVNATFKNSADEVRKVIREQKLSSLNNLVKNQDNTRKDMREIQQGKKEGRERRDAKEW